MSNLIYLITGAGGSLGNELTRQIVDKKGYTVRAFDTHEASLAALNHKNVRLLLGNVCDRDRLEFALKGVTWCIHTASYKNLNITEYSLEQTIETNIVGTLETAKACINSGVKAAILISSDKAVEPTSAYGVTKLMQECIWLWASRIQRDTRFIIVRMGNFIASSGSVFEVWEQQKELGEKLTITDPRCSRYFISIEDAASFTLKMLHDGETGKIYVPKMDETNIMELAGVSEAEIDVIGLRVGEKLREILFGRNEEDQITDRGDFFEIR